VETSKRSSVHHDHCCETNLTFSVPIIGITKEDFREQFPEITEAIFEELAYTGKQCEAYVDWQRNCGGVFIYRNNKTSKKKLMILKVKQ
jgi:hypothetical protein